MLTAWVAAAALLWAQSSGQDILFAAHTDLQGLYDESSQATLQFLTAEDVDQFHSVLCTPDWVFVDNAGKTHRWADARAEELRVLAAPRADAITQTIDKMALVTGGANTTVTRRTVRTIVDADGRYGPKGAQRSITETTLFRDTWVKSGEVWKQKSREQVGETKTGPTPSS